MQKLIIVDNDPDIDVFDSVGDRFWFLDNEPYREGGPSIEWNDGDKE